MGILTKLGTGQGYLKAGIQGFAGSGKTFTATEIAIGLRKFMDLTGPIAFFDTEGGAEFVAQKVLKETGQELIGVRSRAFADLLQTVRECEESGVSVLLVDSVTHVWEEVQRAHMRRVNENIKRRNPRAPSRHRLEFQDWAPIKQQWAEWTTAFLNSRLHIVFCGRAGFTYDHETNEENGKKELIKTGTKMKAENEFGFEPSLLIEMEAIKEKGKKGQFVHRATILKDRWDAINGQEFDDPTFETFLPHIRNYKPGAHAPIDTAIKTEPLIDEEGNDERRRRAIYAEEIQNDLVMVYPTQSVEHKKMKIQILKDVFGTTSWTAIEGMGAERLRAGRDAIRNALKQDEDAPNEPEGPLEIPFGSEAAAAP